MATNKTIRKLFGKDFDFQVWQDRALAANHIISSGITQNKHHSSFYSCISKLERYIEEERKKDTQTAKDKVVLYDQLKGSPLITLADFLFIQDIMTIVSKTKSKEAIQKNVLKIRKGNYYLSNNIETAINLHSDTCFLAYLIYCQLWSAALPSSGQLADLVGRTSSKEITDEIIARMIRGTMNKEKLPLWKINGISSLITTLFVLQKSRPTSPMLSSTSVEKLKVTLTLGMISMPKIASFLAEQKSQLGKLDGTDPEPIKIDEEQGSIADDLPF